jgi:hypothetical protein
LVKRVEEFVFFQITDVTQFRQKLKKVIPLIKTTAQVQKDLDDIAEHKKSGGKGLLKISGANIAFSQFGLTKVCGTFNR